MKVKINIKSKLFLLIISLLAANILIMLVFGSTFLEKFYVYQKKAELNSHQKSIQSSYTTKGANSQQFYEQAQKCEEANINILIFEYKKDWSSAIAVYPNTLTPSVMQPSGRIDYKNWFSSALSNGIIDDLEGNKNIIRMQENADNSPAFIYLFSRIDDSTYLFLRTPTEYIQTVSNNALQFFIYLSLSTLVIGIAATYFVSSKIAKPIKQIDKIAQKIAAMDFTEKCDIHTGDEVEALANSVNIMSDKLRENIDVLKKDLQREETTNKIRREFIANVSHDFKTPLSLISAYGESLKDSANDNDTKETCDIILEQSAMMNILVNQLLTLSQLESGMISYDMTFFSITDIIQTVAKNCKILIDNKKISYILKSSEDYIVKGDHNRITQVYTNLFENAIKYVDDNKVIEVSIIKRDDKVRINIFNSSKPIEQQELENIFDSFYRADKSRDLSNKSHGIGLAIVKTIMEAHGGEYGVYNSEGGVNFWFELELFEIED